MGNRTFVHDGHSGDVVASLPTIRALGGGTLVLTNHHLAPMAWRPMRGDWGHIPSAYDALRPLLVSLPYITGVEWQDNPTDFTHDFRGFRHTTFQYGRSIALAQAMHLGLDSLDLSPWIDVSGLCPGQVREHMSGRVAVSRTTRHLTEGFPWGDLLSQHSCVFIGLKHEKEVFEQEFGLKIDFVPTRDFLGVAMAISASKLFIGNQSCQCWIAMAMGHPLIQETMDRSPDSIITRDNAVFLPCRTIEV